MGLGLYNLRKMDEREGTIFGTLANLQEISVRECAGIHRAVEGLGLHLIELGETMPIVFIEKCCSHCGTMNWDSDTGVYGNDCTADDNKDKPCDLSGEVRKWDENNKRVDG